MKNIRVMFAIGAITFALSADKMAGKPLREIVDPATGLRWVLAPDASHPGGPGKLAPGDPAEERYRTVIRAGDKVLVEEHSERVDLLMEAVALAPAGKGERFSVRLRIGGTVLSVSAVSAGRAVLKDERSTR